MNLLKPPPPRNRAAEPDERPPALGDPSMEIAHVLYMDVVGYSRLRMNQQAAAQIELQNLVNASPEVQQAKVERKFICRPAGDGMALLFFRDLVSPVRTALQIHEEMHRNAAAIQARVGTSLKLRMGIHSGTVLIVADLNDQSDAAGDGINIAQRVMDCGDADHILVSGKVAESLLTVDPWQRYLRDLGLCRVKHGTMVHLYLLHGRLGGAYYGNVGIPERVRAEQQALDQESARFRGTIFERQPKLKAQLVAWAVLALIVGGIGAAWRSVPAFQHAVRDTYARLTKHSAPAKPPVHEAGNHGDHRRTATATGERETRRAARAETSGAPTSRVLVPDLMGKGMDEASGILDGSGFHLVKRTSSGYNTQYGEGLICRQNPQPGSFAPEGTRLAVQISKGDAPDPGTTASPDPAPSP